MVQTVRADANHNTTDQGVPMKRISGAVALVVALALASGCSNSTKPESDSAAERFTTISAPTLKAGDAIPAPVGKVIVTVTGEGLRSNSADGVAFDLASLESLGLVEAVIHEPFEKKDFKFTGVELRRVLAAAGAGDAAVHTVALDDYQADFTAADIAAGGILLATQADGSHIGIDEGGPARLVFLPSSETGRDGRQWIWSVARIDVQP
jgi:hypothetical protein